MRIEDNFAINQARFNSKFNEISGNENSETNEGVVGFGDVLKKCLEDTNNKLSTADSTATRFIKGEDVSVDDVMIKNQEASLSLQFLTQTRDKLLEGYNQLSRLQL
ncbi:MULTISPECIES: flagellar hook-basal body complex protein FliE [Clostridium]|jgi:flagellar hook-basal body complex protein FliE|uniref:Flagellar hook-basal body complex protein FliE n=1 Tax=Clostridium saccharoperbutylacetonicum N1-4(HMT) TaxID=931276 RepID=M1MUD7_9CLOT|nr:MULTISPECIES: flagellar hook-basal body complex protein FliE [Clostridium]AGF58276.1 flagellar hook-basal body complex protein FliE [Clostridium saccharoperbutylacetonicum N1-4(HMT)]AQR96961.1 flagellar hook-basal body complex protein FliE [Clostridium saccharoperbutylacetonicum]NRT60947.1 flagellar hook-basal body complex protein FliE [Clostridium saccharoperbutylacetonicum]NSB24260.1 flagellar hook-basal body complex protein FliE [Clostridium saccharoperbutylacetonicum]NSB32840.1 flagella